MSYIGTYKLGKLCLSDTPIAKAYLGDDLIFSGDGSSVPSLPYDTEIEYLQSSGTQYINTGIKLTTNFKCEIKAQYLQNNNTFDTLLGAIDGVKYGVPIGLQSETGGNKLYVQLGSPYYALSDENTLDLHTFVSKLYNNTQSLDVDGTTVSANFSGDLPDVELYLFARNKKSSVGNYTTAKVYYCKIWNGDVLVRHFIPVRVGQVGYMYDRVSGELFENLGTGSFSLGQDIVKLQFIESTGTQYVNTGVIQSTRNFEMSMHYKWVGSTNSDFESFFAYMEQGSSITPRCGFHKYSGRWMFGTNETVLNLQSVDKNEHEMFWTSNASTNKEELYLDGTKLGTGTSTSNGISTNTIPFYVFARNRMNSIDNPSSLRLMGLNYKEFSDSNHETLLREYNYIPVRIGLVGYLYETINAELLPNIGTGDFVLSQPYDCEVEYLQSNGTQYIDTGINGQSVTRFIVDGYCYSEVGTNKQLLGGTEQGTSTFFGARDDRNSCHWYCMYNGNGLGDPTHRSTIDATIVSSSSQTGTLTDLVSETSYSFTSFSSGSWSFSNSNLLIFGGYSSRRSPNARCYSLKLYTDGDTLVRDFIPVRVGQVGYMYDKVSRKLFANAGTGSFTLGNDITT